MNGAPAPQGGPTVDLPALRRALGSFVTGVTVVTTVDSGGSPQGLTANSFTSVSLDPPLVLVCVNRSARCHDAFATSAGFVVHVLGHDQEELAARFASPVADRWSGLATRPSATGAPILAECIAWLDCETADRLPIGDHLVVVGRVNGFTSESRRPLAYCQGSFLPLDPEALLRGDGADHAVIVRWLLDVDGRLALIRDASGAMTLPCLPPTRVHLDDDALVRQARTELGVRVEIPTLYSMYDDAASATITIVYRARALALSSSMPRDWALVDHADVPWQKIEDSAVASMLRRYMAERSASQFGIYTGSVHEGRVAAMAAER